MMQQKESHEMIYGVEGKAFASYIDAMLQTRGLTVGWVAERIGVERRVLYELLAASSEVVSKQVLKELVNVFGWVPRELARVLEEADFFSVDSVVLL